MPILSRETDLFPSDLLDQDTASDKDASWWAVYTRSRHEKQFMRRLLQLEVPFYGPMVAHRNRSPSGRIRTSWMPLFSNYVFIYGDDGRRHSALTTNCVSKTIRIVESKLLVHNLRDLYQLINVGAPVTRESQIEPGQYVRVKTGPFAGREGTVIQRRGQTRLLVVVDFLQQGASVELDDCEVEPL